MAGELEQLPLSKRRLLLLLKQWGSATITDLAREMGMTGEAIRQKLIGPQRAGWIARQSIPPSGEAGRPAARYRLSQRGEQLFPKEHASLAVALIDSVHKTLGDEALLGVITHITDARVNALAPHADSDLVPGSPVAASAPSLAAKDEGSAPLASIISKLGALYSSEDPFLEISKCEGGYRIIERNCPFLDVALARPLLCSSTVTVLTRLLGRRVVREERFQDGHGRCVFRIDEDQLVDVTELRFMREPERALPGTP